MANLKDVRILGDGVYLFELEPLNVELCKPIFIGVVCLELAKLFMVKYHYRVIKHFGRKRVILVYTDTDSFIYLFFVDNLYDSLMYFRDEFDFSSYPPSHPLHNIHNRGVRGKWKDEKNGQIIEEGVFLRAKCYSLKMAAGSAKTGNSQAASGVRKSVQKHLTHESYRRVLFESEPVYVSQTRFGSENHQLFTYTELKRALDSFDDKRYQINRFTTLPYGYHSLNF